MKGILGVNYRVVRRGNLPAGLAPEVSPAAVDDPLQPEPVGRHRLIGDESDVDAALVAGEEAGQVAAAEVAQGAGGAAVVVLR